MTEVIYQGYNSSVLEHRAVTGTKFDGDIAYEISTSRLWTADEDKVWVRYPNSSMLIQILAVAENEDRRYPFPLQGGDALMEYILIGRLYGREAAEAYASDTANLRKNTICLPYLREALQCPRT